MQKPKALIIDIDGCLANINHRVHFVERFCNCFKEEGANHAKDCLKMKPKDWESFFAAQKDDKVNEWCRNLIEIYYENNYDIIFVTGRPKKYFDVTGEWITKHVMQLEPFPLYMRPDENHGNDDEIKKKIYEEHIKDKYDVEFVIEDRKKVVQMWRSLGLVCLQPAEGDF